MTIGPRIYNLFPLLCGPLSTWGKHLARIADMKFDWIFVNPFHLPGSSGSLYSVKDYYRYNPLIVPEGEDGDRALQSFVAACEQHRISLMIDLVINHTAKDSVLTEQHPEWYRRKADGTLVSAGCEQEDGTFVEWEDLAELNYEDDAARQALIAYWCDMVRHYAGLGVRGFRCDAAYQVPAEVWTPIIVAARAVRPDAIFAAETLGCTPEQVEALRPAGFDFLFNSSAWWDFEAPYLLEQYELYRHFAPSIGFPESHDTERLVSTLQAKEVIASEDVERAYRARYLFAAAFSTGVMMPIGYEYGFATRLHVVETRPEAWEQPRFDLSQYIAEVHEMKAGVGALNEEGPQELVTLAGGEPVTALLRRSNDGGSWVLTLINPDILNSRTARTDGVEVDLPRTVEVTPGGQGQSLADDEVTLEPGQVRVFAGAAEA